MRYFARPVDPYAVVNHPWQPFVAHAHVWTAPLLVFAVGLIWHGHVWDHWRRGVRARRPSGTSMLVTAAPMILSGYFIQTAVGEGWRTAWVCVHVATGVLWVVGYLWHQLASKRRSVREGRTMEPAGGATGRARGGRQ